MFLCLLLQVTVPLSTYRPHATRAGLAVALPLRLVRLNPSPLARELPPLLSWASVCGVLPLLRSPLLLRFLLPLLRQVQHELLPCIPSNHLRSRILCLRTLHPSQ